MIPDLKEFIKTAKDQTVGQGTTPSAKKYTSKNRGSKHGLKIDISFGIGRASSIPWIAFIGFNQTVRNGIYPVYLFYKDFDILILAYGVSQTNLPSNNWVNLDSKQTIEEYFEINFSKKPAKYGSSYVFKVYDATNLPSESILKSDLEDIIVAFKAQFEEGITKKIPQKTSKTKSTVKNEKLDMAILNKNISQSGLLFSEILVSRFVASLLTKPFVLLTGLSGSGKTKIAQAFIRWICEDSTQYRIIPVGSDWTNREPLLGYPNGLNSSEYVLPDSEALNIIIEASKEKNQQKPYFLILDEMNLSHVERYFADFLSIMESEEEIMLYSGDLRKGSDKIDVPDKISWPKNLFVIGTVNIDETTYMFSPKVLDRANTIEFRIDNNNIKSFLEQPSKIDLDTLEGKGASLAQHFLELAKNDPIDRDEVYTATFVRFFNELKKIGAEFGYRTAYEMLLLIKKLNTIGEFTKEQSIDIAVMQKLLPKLHGSRSKISKVLDALILLCLKDGSTFSIAKSEEVESEQILYPITFEKLVRMYKNALDNGFTSYAEA